MHRNGCLTECAPTRIDVWQDTTTHYGTKWELARLEVEQAIFTSLIDDQRAGYHLTAASPGLRDSDARELAVWGPSHDSLWTDESGVAESINFHPLPSGAYCVSRTTVAGAEYSGRGGANIYTHCLILSAGDFKRFGDNPFAVLTAAKARGAIEVRQPVPERLDPLRLPGRSASGDMAVLRELSSSVGANHFASFLAAVLEHPRVAVCAGRVADRCIRGLFSCVPIECRGSFSFSTGLRYSPRRPFRLVGLPRRGHKSHREPSRYGLFGWHLVEDQVPEPPAAGWPRLVYEALIGGQYDFLRQCLSEPRPGLRLDNLQHLGERLREQMRRRPLVASQRSTAPARRSASRSPAASPARGASNERELRSSEMTLVRQLAGLLHRSPHDTALWQRWVAAHEEALAQGRAAMAAELVRRACQVFATQGGARSGDARSRVAGLLEQQCRRAPRIFRRTRECLATLKTVFDRDAWLALADEVASRLTDAPLPGSDESDGSGEPDESGGSGESGESRLASLRTTDQPFQGIRRRYDAARTAIDKSAATADANDRLDEAPEPTPIDAPGPSEVLGVNSPRVVEQLERLDDTIFEAIAGKRESLEVLRDLWPETLRMLGPELVEESKAQYIRHALSVWNQCVQGEMIRRPSVAIAVMEVLEIVLGESPDAAQGT